MNKILRYRYWEKNFRTDKVLFISFAVFGLNRWGVGIDFVRAYGISILRLSLGPFSAGLSVER